MRAYGLFLVLGMVVASSAFSAEGLRAPNRKPPAPVLPEGFMEDGPNGPPASAENSLALDVPSTVWRSAIAAGWCYGNQVSDHQFTGVGGASYAVRRESGTPLCGFVEWTAKPPGDGIYHLEAAMSLALGDAEAKASGSSLASTRFNFQEFGGRFGPRFLVLRSGQEGGLFAGADLGFHVSTEATLDFTQTHLEADQRRMLLVTPRLKYRHVPHPNWSIELGAGYSLPLSSGSGASMSATRYRLFDLGLVAQRYVSPATLMGVTVGYENRNVAWSQQASVRYDEETKTSNLRLGVFWRRQFWF